MRSSNRIVVFEHEVLTVDPDRGFYVEHLNALLRYATADRRMLLEPVYNGIRFTSYVGAIRVRDLVIEVLPKIDRVAENDHTRWQRILIQMLRDAGMLKVNETGVASLHLLRQSVLELYFILFVQECERLVHRGLVRRYRQTSGNLYVLKGALQFSRHVSQNIVHEERFYTRHTVYDHNNRFNQILYLTLEVIQLLNLSPALSGRIHSLMAFFPVVERQHPSEKLFETLPYSRNTEHYRQAMEIARMILLNYHPDIRSGNNHVLALMFDMNRVWEQWIGKQLMRHLPGWEVLHHPTRPFWTPEHGGSTIKLQPDFLLTSPSGQRLIIDTKWKLPNNNQPSEQDLRQIFAYNMLFHCQTGILLYPGYETHLRRGTYCYYPNETSLNCHTLYLNIIDSASGLLKGNEVKKVMDC
jgi:5-methylcytosine-specific restriction enzyme subunit McrC